MIANKTRVAVLGSLAEFHEKAVAFNLKALLDLVVEAHPDLLCLDIDPGMWQGGEFDTLPPEYRKALIPLSERSDIVVVPIGEYRQSGREQLSGWRGGLVRWLRSSLSKLQRTAPNPEAVNYGWRHDLANLLYALIDWLNNRDRRVEHEEHARHLIQRIRQVVARDPGVKVLVVVNVRYCHIIRPALRTDPNIIQVSFQEL